MNELQYCIDQLKELMMIAKRANQPLLVYLLEMALAEAHDQVARRRTS